MNNKVFLAIILSEYQELNLKRFIDHFKINEKIIVFKLFGDQIKENKFKNNVIKINFYNRLSLISYLFFYLFKYLFCKKKFIFGNPESNLNIFLRKFISGKNQVYLDDGTVSLSFNYNKLKKDSVIFTIYNLSLPAKLKKINFIPKYIKKKRKTSNRILFIGSPFVSINILSKKKFIEVMQIISKMSVKFYYFPHRREKEELKILPKNFEIINRRLSAEQFLYNNEYNYKLIYSFTSSSMLEIIKFYKKKSLKLLDISSWLNNSKENINRKKRWKNFFLYSSKNKIDIIKLKKIN